MEIIKGIFVAIFCSCLALALHLAINLFRKGRQVGEPAIIELMRQTKLALAIWVGAFVLFIYLFFIPPVSIVVLTQKISRWGQLPGYAYGIILYAALCFIYLTIYYVLDRSVSATLLEIIENSPEGKLSGKQIKEIYGVEKKYQSELNGMLEGSFTVEEAGFYSNSLKGRLYARIAWMIKIILKLGPGG